jgi:hypothetical protein
MSNYVIVSQEETLNAATTETLLQLRSGAAKSTRVVRWGVSFNGVTITNQPVRVELIRQNSNGTASTVVPTKADPASDAPLGAGASAFTAEPTSAEVLEVHFVTPAAGNLIEAYAPDERYVVAPNGRLGVRVLAADNVVANAFLVFAE